MSVLDSSMSEEHQLEFTDIVGMSLDLDLPKSLDDFLSSYNPCPPFHAVSAPDDHQNDVVECQQESIATPTHPPYPLQDNFAFEPAAALLSATADVKPAAAPPRRKRREQPPTEEQRKKNAERSSKNRQKEKLKKVQLQVELDKVKEEREQGETTWQTIVEVKDQRISELTRQVEDLQRQLMEAEKWRQETTRRVCTLFTQAVTQAVALIEGGGGRE